MTTSQQDQEETRGLTEHQLAAWVRFVSVVELLGPALDSQLRRDARLTHFDFRVLSLLSYTPQLRMRMSELAAQNQATPARLSHVVSRLEQRGLVRRERGAEDSRTVLAALTDQGVELLDQAAPEHRRLVRHLVIDALSEDQLSRLGEASEAILHRLDPVGETQPLVHRHRPTS